jgi:fructose-bisphosphate aldolase class I
MRHDLERIAAALVASGKGILAADETPPTLTKRFDALGIRSTEQSRRTYREMLFTPVGVAEFISGVIMQDETLRQQSSDGTPPMQRGSQSRELHRRHGGDIGGGRQSGASPRVAR